MVGSKEDLAKKVFLKYVSGEGSLTSLSKKYRIRRETVWKWTKEMERDGVLVRGSTGKNNGVISRILRIFGF